MTHRAPVDLLRVSSSLLHYELLQFIARQRPLFSRQTFQGTSAGVLRKGLLFRNNQTTHGTSVLPARSSSSSLYRVNDRTISSYSSHSLANDLLRVPTYVYRYVHPLGTAR
jgi:hypothetical protein